MLCSSFSSGSLMLRDPRVIETWQSRFDLLTPAEQSIAKQAMQDDDNTRRGKDRVRYFMKCCAAEESSDRQYQLRAVVMGKFILDLFDELYEKHTAWVEEEFSMSHFKATYASWFEPYYKTKKGGLTEEEWVFLRNFLLAMRLASHQLLGNNHLNKTLLIAACASIEGSEEGRRYISGSRQSRETCCRHLIFHNITGCVPVRRCSSTKIASISATASAKKKVVHKSSSLVGSKKIQKFTAQNNSTPLILVLPNKNKSKKRKNDALEHQERDWLQQQEEVDWSIDYSLRELDASAAIDDHIAWDLLFV